jgi:hypothetical protein
VIQLIDDQLLGGLLRGDRPPRRRAQVFTTGYWYVRLCQAVLSAGGRTGVLPGPFAALPSPARDRATRRLLELPETIGLVSLRDLAPLIGQLRERHELNILAMEALAAAVQLEADTYLSAPSPRLQHALHAEGRRVEIL